MRKVSFHVEKGGTGKTTMAGNTAYTMAHHEKTLLVDCDPQGNLTSWYVTKAMKWEMADVLQEKCPLAEALIPVRDKLFVLPTFGIDGGLKTWSETTLFQKPFAFSDLMDKLEGEKFSVAVFDLGPGISNLEKSILACMDEIVGVAAAEYFSVDGLEIFDHELEKLRRDRRGSFVADKLVVNRVNFAYALHKIYQEQFRKLRYDVFTVGQSTAISDCVPKHLSLFEYDPSNKNIVEFQRLATALATVGVNA